MNKISRKIIAALLCGAMLMGVSACGSKNAGTGTEDKAAGTISQGAQDGTQAASEVAAMGRYVESSIALPEGADILGRNIAVLEDGRWAYLDGSIGMYISSDEGASWTPGPEMTKFDSDKGFVSSGAIVSDGSFGLCWITSVNEKLTSTIAYVGQDGAVKEFSGAMSGGYINRIFAVDGNDMYGITTDNKICSIDPRKGDIKPLFEAADITEMLAVSDGRLMALERGGVELYDLEKGMILESDSVLDTFCRENMANHLGNSSESMGGIILPGEEGSVYLASRMGVYRHVLNGNAMEQLIDGEYSTFGDPLTEMCSMVLLESGEFLLATGGESLTRFTYDAKEPATPEKQLKVYSLRESYRIRQAASQFQKEHSDVFVRYEYGLEEGTGMTAADAIKNLNVELMSGNGPDVIVLDGMEEEVYSEKGLLKDLTPVLDSLMEQGVLFENIMAPYRTEKGAFVIPATFKLPLIFGKKEDVAQIKDLESMAEFVVKAHSENPRGSVFSYINPKETLAQLLLVEGSGLMNGKELDIQALTRFLTQAKKLYGPNMEDAPAEYKNEEWGIENARIFGGSTTDVYVGASRMATGLAGSILDDLGLAGLMEEQGYEVDLWSGSNGVGFVPGNKLAIAANSVQTELAEEFVKLALSTDVQKVSWGDGFAVNREAFDLAGELDKGVSTGSTFMLNGIERKINYEFPGKETVDRLKELVMQAEQPLEGNMILEEAVKDYGEPVLTGETSVEEAVEAIRKKVGLYLAE